MNRNLKIAAITIGQSPRPDIMKDIQPLLPDYMEIIEYGALDDLTFEQIMEQFHPLEDDEILISRMRDGRQAKFTERFVTPYVQKKITQAEKEGSHAIILFCTGVFPDFECNVLFFEPQLLFHSTIMNLAGNMKIGMLVPDSDQISQSCQLWQSRGVDIVSAYASPYKDPAKLLEAAEFFKKQDVDFICTDCMGYTIEMKHKIQRISGKPVLIPRTLVVRILCEMFS